VIALPSRRRLMASARFRLWRRSCGRQRHRSSAEVGQHGSGGRLHQWKLGNGTHRSSGWFRCAPSDVRDAGVPFCAAVNARIRRRGCAGVRTGMDLRPNGV
jgi:hypothetical protein